MKRIGFLFVLVVFSFRFVNAEACDNNDIARLKEIANNVGYNSNYVGNDLASSSYQDYDVSFYGLTDELYVTDYDDNFRFYSTTGSMRFQSGVITLDIYSKNCFRRLKSIVIELPKFNEYSLSDDCVTYKDDNLDVCDPWYQGDIDYRVFNSLMEEQAKKNEKRDYVDIVEDIWINNKILIISIAGVIVVIFILLIYRIRKKNELN